MDDKMRELVAVGASVAANCYPCLKFHLSKCKDLEIAREDLQAAAEVGMMVNRGAASNTRKFSAELLGTAELALES
jgi:AhpD family alkylhydroperoxidase